MDAREVPDELLRFLRSACQPQLPVLFRSHLPRAYQGMRVLPFSTVSLLRSRLLPQRAIREGNHEMEKGIRNFDLRS